MKKITVLFLLLIFILSGCNQQDIPSSNDNITKAKTVSFYKKFLDDLSGNQTDSYYYIKDIDGNSVDDLIILENTKLSVYTYENAIRLIGEHDFLTGTVRFFCSSKNQFPGVFYFTVGGSSNHYGYMTIKDENLLFEDLWEESYDIDSQDSSNRINELSYNKGLISESKTLFNKNCDIKFLSLK